MEGSKKATFSKGIILAALWQGLKKFNPQYMWKNPVMFIVEIGMLISFTLIFSQMH